MTASAPAETTYDLLDLFWSPLSYQRSFASTATTVAPAPAAVMASASAVTFTDPDILPSYIRPNGLVYLPRNLMVGENKVQDVTLLRQSIAAKLPVLLYGEPGCGKTALVEAAFADELITVQGTIETETADFVGSWTQQPDGTYQWVDGPLVVAMVTGRKLLIDEIALIDPRVMAIVYGVMDGRDELTVTQNPLRGSIHVTEGFAVIGACNPNVPGAQMSDALLSRFAIHMEMTTDWSLASKLGIGAKIVQVVRNANEKFSRGELTQAPQLREMIQFRDVASQFGEPFALRNFISQVRPENRATIITLVEGVFGTTTQTLTL